MRLDYFANLRCQTNSLTLLIGIRYSTHDLISAYTLFALLYMSAIKGIRNFNWAYMLCCIVVSCI